MKIKVVNLSNNVAPSYKTEGASGMDICAYLEEPMILKPMDIVVVPTGIKLEIPEGNEVQVRARSGLAAKHGISLVNGIGTIDSDYRGEVGVIMINLGRSDFVINNGDRIAQLVAMKYEKVELEIVDELNETKRNEGGFGHSGIR